MIHWLKKLLFGFLKAVAWFVFVDLLLAAVGWFFFQHWQDTLRVQLMGDTIPKSQPWNVCFEQSQPNPTPGGMAINVLGCLYFAKPAKGASGTLVLQTPESQELFAGFFSGQTEVINPMLQGVMDNLFASAAPEDKPKLALSGIQLLPIGTDTQYPVYEATLTHKGTTYPLLITLLDIRGPNMITVLSGGWQTNYTELAQGLGPVLNGTKVAQQHIGFAEVMQQSLRKALEASGLPADVIQQMEAAGINPLMAN